jgi:hypothetical protein
LAQTLAIAKVGARSDWKVQVVVFTGGTPGSVEIERFENNLKLLTSKRKNGPISGNYMPEHFWRPTMRSYKHTMKQYMPAKAQEHIIDITQHRMSICRGNSRRAQADSTRSQWQPPKKVICMGPLTRLRGVTDFGQAGIV